MDYKKQHKVKTIIFAACLVLFAATFGFIQWNRNKLKEMMPVVGKVSGTFFLDRQEYCVGEPIVVTFYAINGMNCTHSFDVGGDYRNGDGGLRHERYSFEVADHSGRSFTKKGESVGGLGETITLKPGEIYVSYQLVSSRAHLLPPGKYHLQCGTTLKLDSYKNTVGMQGFYAPVTIKTGLFFRVVQYNRDKIVESINRLKKGERIPLKGHIKSSESGKPIRWALADMSEKFQTGVTRQSDNDKFMTAVIKTLPKRWHDRFYLEYKLESNRNWLTLDNPEEYLLTFSVRNNFTGDLPHGLTNSTLSVEGNSIREWPDMLKEMLNEAGIAEMVKAGQTIEISGKFNDFLKPGIEQQFIWKIGKINYNTDVRFRKF